MTQAPSSDDVFQTVLDVVKDVKTSIDLCFNSQIFLKAITVGCGQQGIKAVARKEHYIRYKDEYVGSFFFDLVVEDLVAVTVKSDEAQDDDAFVSSCRSAKLDGLILHTFNAGSITTFQHANNRLTTHYDSGYAIHL